MSGRHWNRRFTGKSGKRWACCRALRGGRDAPGLPLSLSQDARGKKLRKHGSHGQEQTYFLCHLKPDAPQVNVKQKQREFRAYRWILPIEFDLDWLPPFKRDVYREVMRDFFQVEL